MLPFHVQQNISGGVLYSLGQLLPADQLQQPLLNSFDPLHAFTPLAAQPCTCDTSISLRTSDKHSKYHQMTLPTSRDQRIIFEKIACSTQRSGPCAQCLNSMKQNLLQSQDSPDRRVTAEAHVGGKSLGLLKHPVRALLRGAEVVEGGNACGYCVRIL